MDRINQILSIFVSAVGVYLALTLCVETMWGSRAFGDDKVPITPMVSVPEGKFWMGAGKPDSKKDNAEHEKDEYPGRWVELDAFQIDRTEVTNAQYQRFIEATGHTVPPFWEKSRVLRLSRQTSAELRDRYGAPDKPVVFVSWDEARTYCVWAEKRLPTEAEWEKAARGTDGRKYPWGDEPYIVSGEWTRKFATGPTPVGSFPKQASPYGALDMFGSVLEWVADWYSSDYYKKAPKRNPPGPSHGTKRVIRGALYPFMTVTNRIDSKPDDIRGNQGFRCARDGIPPNPPRIINIE